MPPAFLYYLLQAWTADPYRQADRRRMAQAATRTRPDHQHGERPVPGHIAGVLARRVRATLGARRPTPAGPA
jgi:hypothetical protein